MSRIFDGDNPKDVMALEAIIRINPDLPLELTGKEYENFVWYKRSGNYYTLTETITGSKQRCFYPIARTKLYRIEEEIEDEQGIRWK